jgi:hypothetical protein
MATDFASYLFESMTPEQQAAYIAQGQAQGVTQAPTANYEAGLRPDQVKAIEQFYADQARAKGVKGDIRDPKERANFTNGNLTDFGKSVSPYAQGIDDLENPHNYVPGSPNYQPGGNAGNWSPETAILQREAARIAQQDAAAKATIGGLGNDATATNAKNDAAIARMNQLIDAQDPNNAAYIGGLQGLAGQLGGYRDTANSQATSALNTYLDKLNGADADIHSSLGNLDSTFASIKDPLQSTVKWDGDLTSQAAQADPQALAAQNAALGMLAGTAGGALDYSSQAALANADPKYLAMRDKGLEDLYGVSQGTMDIRPGQLDPAAYKAVMSALSQMGKLTNPAETDQERFLYEKARQEQETDERGADAAMMSKLRRQGMAGGGAQLTQGALTNQRLSQNRLLSDLAASGAAVARSQDMLKSYGALGGQLNSEANQLATGNANRKLQALGLYEQGSETAEQASFDQEYKRGLASDQASRDNQQTRLSGQIAYGNEANAMQDDAFNRGQAADNMAQYNRTTSLDVDMFNNNFSQRERDALANRTATQTGLHLSGDAQLSNNATNAFTGTQTVTDNNFTRDALVNRTNAGILDTQSGLEREALGRRLGTQAASIGVNQTNFGNNVTVGGLNLDQLKFNTGAMLGNDDKVLAGISTETATRATEKAHNEDVARDNDRGVFGTTILSANSVNGKKFPILGFG